MSHHNPIRPKVKAATAGAAVVGTPAGLVVVWLAGQFGVEMPAEVGAIVGGWLASAVAFAAGYFQPAEGRKADHLL